MTFEVVIEKFISICRLPKQKPTTALCVNFLLYRAKQPEQPNSLGLVERLLAKM